MTLSFTIRVQIKSEDLSAYERSEHPHVSKQHHRRTRVRGCVNWEKSVKQTGTWAALHTCPSPTHRETASDAYTVHAIPNRSDKQSVSSGILSGVLSAMAALIKGHEQFGRRKELCFWGHPFNPESPGVTRYQLWRFWLTRASLFGLDRKIFSASLFVLQVIESNEVNTILFTCTPKQENFIARESSRLCLV